MTYDRHLHQTLPSGSSKLERGMVYAFDTPPHERVIPKLWDVDHCPLQLLPWLAWSLNVDTWTSDWPESYKRQILRNAQEIQAIKGTIGAVKQALADLGHGSAQVFERVNGGRFYGEGDTYSDTVNSFNYGDAGMWATFSVKLFSPISIAQGSLIIARLDSVKRACVHLINLDFSSAPLMYGSTNMHYDDQYTYGVI